MRERERHAQKGREKERKSVCVWSGQVGRDADRQIDNRQMGREADEQTSRWKGNLDWVREKWSLAIEQCIGNVHEKKMYVHRRFLLSLCLSKLLPRNHL